MRLPLLITFLLALILGTPASAQTWLNATAGGGQYEEQSRAIGVDAAGNSYITGFFVQQTVFGGNQINAYGNDGTDIFIAKYNPTGTLLWMKRFGGFEDDFAYDIKVDASGNLFMVGHFQLTATFGTFSVTSQGVYDIFVAKLNSNGDPLWVQRYGGPSTDFGHSLALDGSGNIFITGNFMGTAVFGTTSLVSAGSTDTYVAKLDPLGNVLWAKRAGGILSENAYKLALDPSGNPVITGNFMLTAGFDTFSLTSAGNGDIYVAKYDGANGDVLWAKRHGNFREDAGLAIGTDALGNIYASGFYQEPITFDAITLPNSGNYDIYLVKYSPAGVVEWARRAGGSLYDAAWGIHVTPAGDSYLTGYFQGTALFGTLSVNSNGAQDIFVANYNTAGVPQWVRSAGGPQYDIGFAITLDASNNSRVTGFFSATASFSPLTISSAGSYDAYVARLGPGCPSTVNAGTNATVCSGQTASIGSAAQPGYTYTWSVSPAIPGFSSNQSSLTLTMPPVINQTVYTFTLTANTPGCAAATSAVFITVNPSPQLVVSPSPAGICTGGSLQLTASGATAYTWTPAPTLAGSGSTVTVTPAATTTYSVSGSIGNCLGPVTAVPVTVNTIPPAPTASNSGPACAGGSVNLSAGTVAGATYSWVGPNSFSATGQIVTAQAGTTTSSATYTVFAVNSGCVSPASTTTVSITTAPTASVASSNSPLCTGSALNLSAATVAGSTYSWAGPGGFSSTNQFPVINNITSGQAGTYTVYAVSANGCVSTPATVAVTTVAAPVATATNTGPSCNGATLILQAATVFAGTYSWIGPNNFNSAQQSPVINNITAASSGNYTLTVTAGGCTSSAITNVIVNQNLPAPAITSNSPVCLGSILTLAGPTAAGTVYSWTGPGNFSSADQQVQWPAASLAEAGLYSLTIVQNGCTSLVSTTLVEVNEPVPAPIATTSGLQCSGQTLYLSASTVAGAAGYSWSGPMGFSSAQQFDTINNITPAASGTYTAFSIVPGCPAAFSTVGVQVASLPVAPVVTVSGSPCVGANLALSASLVPGLQYSWTGPGGMGSGGVLTINNVSIANSGTYTATAYAPGCGSATTLVPVTISPLPVVTVSASANSICLGSGINLTASGATNYTWQPGTGLNSDSTAIVHAAPSAGTIYTVTGTSNGCSSTATFNLAVNIPPTVTIVTSTDTIGAGSGTVLEAQVSGTGPFTYVWTPAAGLSDATIANPVASPGNTTTYTVTVTDQGTGCSTTASLTIVVLSAGEELAKAGLTLTVFPNPFAEVFTVQVNSSREQEIDLVLYDGIGRIVQQRTVQMWPGETNIDFEMGSGYSNGLYMLIMRANHTQKAVRVIRQR